MDQQKGPIGQATASVSDERKAIMVSQKLINLLKISMRGRMKSIDHLAPDRVLLDDVVRQTKQLAYNGGNPVYYSGKRDENLYKWFDSDEAKSIQAQADILDKGRFVEACLVIYLKGFVAEYLSTSREIHPRTMTSETKTMIANKLAEMRVAKSAESEFLPTKCGDEIA